MWATIMKERFGASNARSMLCRFHVQTAGSSLTAQSIDNNVVRTTIQALSAKGNLGFASAAAVLMLLITAVIFLPLVLLTAWQQRRSGARA